MGFSDIAEFNLESAPEESLGDCGGEGGWPRKSFAVDVDIACWAEEGRDSESFSWTESNGGDRYGRRRKRYGEAIEEEQLLHLRNGVPLIWLIKPQTVQMRAPNTQTGRSETGTFFLPSLDQSEMRMRTKATREKE